MTNETITTVCSSYNHNQCADPDCGCQCHGPKKTFDIQLGGFTASYELFETTAPVEYDGFGTISLHENVGPKEPRWVLVRTEHRDWQTMRYRSGMFSVQDADQAGAPMEDVTHWLTETLYKRLTGAK